MIRRPWPTRARRRAIEDPAEMDASLLPRTAGWKSREARRRRRSPAECARGLADLFHARVAPALWPGTVARAGGRGRAARLVVRVLSRLHLQRHGPAAGDELPQSPALPPPAQAQDARRDDGHLAVDGRDRDRRLDGAGGGLAAARHGLERRARFHSRVDATSAHRAWRCSRIAASRVRGLERGRPRRRQGPRRSRLGPEERSQRRRNRPRAREKAAARAARAMPRAAPRAASPPVEVGRGGQTRIAPAGSVRRSERARTSDRPREDDRSETSRTKDADQNSATRTIRKTPRNKTTTNHRQRKPKLRTTRRITATDCRRCRFRPRRGYAGCSSWWESVALIFGLFRYGPVLLDALRALLASLFGGLFDREAEETGEGDRGRVERTGIAASAVRLVRRSLRQWPGPEVQSQ